MTKFNVILDAIQNKNIINFDYDGHTRRVEPHHYGILNGKKQLHAYQTSGGSKTGGIPEWRNFEINKIKYVTLENSNFKRRFDYNPSNANYTQIEKGVDVQE